MGHYEQMEDDLKTLESTVKLDWLLDNTHPIRQDTLEKYYSKINRIAYKRFHSKDGFMHVGVSLGNTAKEEDLYYQTDQIEKYLKSAKNVLELGSGQGANIGLLAAKVPDVQFTGVDLRPTMAKKNRRDNIKLVKQDWHDLSRFKDASFDVVYAIETICYSADKSKVFDEIHRVLKKGGVFIMYDVYSPKEFDRLDDIEQKVLTLICKGCSSDVLETIKSVTSKIEQAGFSKIKSNDLTARIAPGWVRLKRGASMIIHRKILAKIAFRVLPKSFLGNVVVGYVGHSGIMNRVVLYHEHIYKK